MSSDRPTYAMPEESSLHQAPVRGVFERLTGARIVPDTPPKGGQVARQAGIICQDAEFCLYLDRRRRYKHGLSEAQLPDGTHSEQDARDWLCAACRIQSRAELDHNPEAARTFKGIQQRLYRWRARQRATA